MPSELPRLSDTARLRHYPRVENLLRDVGDDSPWYDKALFHAIEGIRDMEDDCGVVGRRQGIAREALRKLEAQLAERAA